MQTDHALRPGRSALLPWALLILLSLGIDLYVFRAPLSLLLTPTPKPGLTSGGVLLGIQSLNNLESVAMHYQVLVKEKKDDEDWTAWFKQQQALFIANGTVTAGVNLGQLTSADVQVSEDGRVVRISLPAPEVLSVNVTEMQTYRIDTGLFGLMPADPTLHDAALRSAQVKLSTLACNSAILDMAAINAERAFERLFTLMGDVEVLVESRAPGACQVARP